ncbi:ThiF family adenylyltransferase [Nonomuraea cavernae]|uniref:ThiF family adenylyltransferase n=1 Tax=Nonomuraea cavernae TaxID=2045107 RepID=UPI0016693F84|nr:ThiF family adenylyltransferase [Nonomuraea cavernae]MCA2190710.1 ThiF family adenylyltransferase [Nonomuraea cavernae]
MRPRVKPALKRILRDEQTLQLGVHPGRAVLLTGLTRSVRQWLDGLDGSRDLGQTLLAASAAGLAEQEARGLLDQLTARGVVHDAATVLAKELPLAERDRLAPDLDALDLASTAPEGAAAALAVRRRARVRVYGAGRVGAQVVTLLAACGVGDIRVIDPGPVRVRDLTPGGLTWAEAGMSRQDGAVAVARRLMPGDGATSSSGVRAGGPYLGDRTERPDLVILAPVGPLDGVLVSELTTLGIAHLLVSAFEGHGSVGPLVLPGRTACLHCLDLTRRDGDPDWPIVTARLGGYPPGEIACDTTLAALMAASVTGHALAYLDGREAAVTNGTVDVMPDWHWKTRPWSPHPECRCMRNNPYSLRMEDVSDQGLT